MELFHSQMPNNGYDIGQEHMETINFFEEIPVENLNILRTKTACKTSLFCNDSEVCSTWMYLLHFAMPWPSLPFSSSV